MGRGKRPGGLAQSCSHLYDPYEGTYRLTTDGERISIVRMRIIAKRTLRDFWEGYPDAEEPLMAWYREAETAEWRRATEVKEKYLNASIVGENRVVFNIKGNDYRLVAEINFEYQVLFVKWIGTHKEYDRIDVLTVEYDTVEYDKERYADPSDSK